MLAPFLMWLTVCLLFFLVELTGVTMFFFLSFSLGAFISALASFYVPDLFWQIIIFLGASGLAILCLRVLFHPTKFTVRATNIDKLPGMRGIVIKPIAHQTTGQVKVGGKIWSARIQDTQILPEDTLIEVIRVEGNHVIVRKTT